MSRIVDRHIKRVAEETGYSQKFVRMNLMEFSRALRYLIRKSLALKIKGLLRFRLVYKYFKSKYVNRKFGKPKKWYHKKKRTKFDWPLNEQVRAIRKFLRNEKYVPDFQRLSKRATDKFKTQINAKLIKMGREPID